MVYLSTRDSSLQKSSMEIIKQGISIEGGLFVPEYIPKLKKQDIEDMRKMDYRQRAYRVLSLFLTDFSQEDLENIISAAYRNDNFDCPEIAPLVKLDSNLFIQELWHGPTYAFKDMALQILPHLMTTAAVRTGDDKEIVILVATSGDTGKAALEGFKDVDGTQVVVFYPHGGVSNIQRLQMVTQEGKNVHVVAIEGNFDDTQTAVKTIFTDREFIRSLDKHGKKFSSANSINWGRLVPQIVYYVSAYIDLINSQALEDGDEFNVVVPTGNFGNILAAYYAKNIGVPIGKLICASNSNNVLSDFINTGVYNINREFYRTISPSMDILISSNLERLLFELCGRQDEQVRKWMQDLKEIGQYKLDDQSYKKLKSHLWGGYANEEQTLAAIRDTYNQYDYIMDPHTAVGKWVYDEYKEATGDNRKTLLVSTASPFKFHEDVLRAILGPESIKDKDEFEGLEILESISGMEIPSGLKDLKSKTIVHKTVVSKDKISHAVKNILGLDGGRHEDSDSTI
ncbi:MAG: threonine synthase [Clostridiales bacterium]|nr:threonine synthase [Clostridiales bacterium]